MIARLATVLALPLLLAACLEEEAGPLPEAQTLTRDAQGHFCRMIVMDHPGPKAQVFLEGTDDPVWFPAVRDMFAFTMLPGESRTIRALYVSDTGAAPSFDKPDPEVWVLAREAHYVLGSGRSGGMGQEEAVPFAEREAAEAFARRHGGRVVGFDEVPADWVFAAPADDARPDISHHSGGSS